MSQENVVISLDGHTECFVDLKPWLPAKCHGPFDEATAEGRRTFTGGSRYFADLMYAGAEMAWQAANDLHEVDLTRYHQVLTCAERLARIDADGVAAELLVDGFGAITSDPKLQHEISQSYCRWFKDYAAPAPHRFTAALAVSLAAGQETVVKEIRMAWEHGLRAIHLPPTPRQADPSLPDYNHRMYEPMWQALNERGMATVWHSSVGREKPLWRWNGTERGWEALLFLDIEGLHHSTLKYLLLSGVPERHPNLKFGYIESGSTWIAPILAQLDRYFAAPTVNPEHKLKMKPSEQWARQGFAAGPLDATEISRVGQLGVRNLAFGSDDIHTEGTWPHTRVHLAKLLAHLSKEDQWAIVAGNAQRIFGFDIDKLAQTPAAQQCWRESKAAA